jgi:hypothetical protein
LTFSGGPVGPGIPRPKNNLKDLFKELGLYGVTGADKRVPEIVFGMGNDSVLNFVGACTATDGSIDVRSNRIVVMSNKSRDLLEGLRTLLLRVGVPTALHAEPNGMFRLQTVGGLRVARHLAKKMPVVGAKGDLKYTLSKKRALEDCKYDILPLPLTEQAIARREASGLSAKCLGNEGHIIKDRRMTRSRAEDVAEALDWPELAVLARGDLAWDEIVSIEDLQPEEMWDLEVEEYHNFVLANGIVAHNTGQIEHDATIGAVFHNDLQIDPGTDVFWIDNNEQDPMDRKKPIVELRILKNKNIDGAFKGVVKFEFDPKRSIFREIADDVGYEQAQQLEPKPAGPYPKGQADQGLFPGFKA